MQWRRAAGYVDTRSRTPHIPRQAEAAMPSIPWVYIEAARFLGGCVASGAALGLVTATLRMLRRG